MYQLHLGDCFELMKSMPDKSVSHIITDPPYSERTHKGARGGNNPKLTTHKDNSLITFDHITEEQFYLFCQEAIRITKRWVIFTCDLNHAGKLEDHPILRNYLVRVGVWVKPNPTPQFTGDRPGQGFETVLIMHDKGRKRWNDGGMPAVWIVNKIQGQHPTKKPPTLIKKWIDQFTDPGETIFDPFMGEGTTGVCALEMGRSFIGCEINPKWFNLAKRQIEGVDAQLGLFEEAIS